MLNVNDYIKTLCANLTMLRAKAALTQAQIAEIIGIPRTTYSAIEQGTRKMTVPICISVSEYYLKKSDTCDLMRFIGLSEDVFENVFENENTFDQNHRRNNKRKLAAFGGAQTRSKELDKKSEIEKALIKIKD